MALFYKQTIFMARQAVKFGKDPRKYCEEKIDEVQSVVKDPEGAAKDFVNDQVDQAHKFANDPMSAAKDYLFDDWKEIARELIDTIFAPLHKSHNPNSTRPKRQKKKKKPKRFDSYYKSSSKHSELPSAKLHESSHHLRKDFELVQKMLTDIHYSLEDLEYLMDMPKELHDDAKQIAQILKVCSTVLKSMRTGGGAIGAALSTFAQSTLKSLEDSVKTSKRMFGKADKSLKPARKLVVRIKEKYDDSSLVKSFEKVDRKLAKLEQRTGKMENPGGQSPWKVSDDIDVVCNEMRIVVEEGRNFLEPLMEPASTVSFYLEKTSKVVVLAKNFRDMITPLKEILDPITSLLKEILDKIMNELMKNSFVKKTLRLVDEAAKWMMDQILEVTGLQKMLDLLSAELNPFKRLNIDLDVCDQAESNLSKILICKEEMSKTLSVLKGEGFVSGYDQIHDAVPMMEEDMRHLPLHVAEYVEVRDGKSWGGAARKLISKLKSKGVQSGQILSIDAHNNSPSEAAIFSAHYSKQLPGTGEPDIEFFSQNSKDSWNVIYETASNQVEGWTRDQVIAMTASCNDGGRGVFYVFLDQSSPHHVSHPLRDTRYAEVRDSNSWGGAARKIIAKLKSTGVQRGQLLSIDAHNNSPDDAAIFSAHFDLSLPSYGELNIHYEAQNESHSWKTFYRTASSHAIGKTKEQIISITGSCNSSNRAVMYMFYYA